MSLPLIGGPFATVLWGGHFPGSTAFESRLFIAHVFLLPAIIGGLIAVHLAIIMRQHHSQFPDQADARTTWSAHRCGQAARCASSRARRWKPPS